MCHFGSRAEWREGIRVVSYYLDVETTKGQCRLLNLTPLECITGYIMYGAVGERDLKWLPQIRMNFIYVSISTYCSIINCPELLEQIRQANKLASVLCDLDFDRMK